MATDTSRTRVLLVSGHSDVAGGGQVSLLLLLKLLDRRRFWPILLCPSEGEVARRARQLGTAVVFLGVSQDVDSLSAVRHAPALRRLAKALGPGVAHCDTLYTALMSGIGLAGLRVPVIFHARVSDSGGILDAIVPRLCAKIICVSKATAARFSTQLSSKLHVIYNGVDLTEFRSNTGSGALRERLGISPDAFVVGYAGQIVKRKGLECLVRAFAQFRSEFPRTTLLIAGRGEDEAALRAAAGDGVLFLPFSESMPDFYATLDVFALPVVKLEGHSRSLIEAMACAVPSVATPLGGNAETLVDGETGFFVPVEDAKALHGRLRDLYLAPHARKRMGAAARRRAEQLFDAVACTRAVEALYLQVCT